MSKEVFVFGSNEAGVHGAGAALHAYKREGARWGFSYGHSGNSFAIPTKNQRIQTLPQSRIQLYVYGFMAYAQGAPELVFKVTQIGCGLAGFSKHDIAPMFHGAPLNCQFDLAWKPILGDQYTYWGTA